MKCVLCRSDEYVYLFSARDNRLHTTNHEFNIVKCKGCGLVSLNPLPDGGGLGKFYPEDYYVPYSPLCTYFYSPIISRILKVIVEDICMFKRKGKILDIGCGIGQLLLAFQNMGYDCFGIDTNHDVLESIPEAVRNKVGIGSLLDFRFEDASFDIVIMKHVLEHLPDPNAELSEVHRVLNDNGILYIEVPNFYCFEAKLFGKYWYNLEVPRHLCQYSVDSFINLLQMNGFEYHTILSNSGFMVFKSPLAIVNSFKYWFRDKMSGIRSFEKIIIFVTFVPLLAITFLGRVLSAGYTGGDIRIIFQKGKRKVD